MFIKLEDKSASVAADQMPNDEQLVHQLLFGRHQENSLIEKIPIKEENTIQGREGNIGDRGRKQLVQ